MADGLWNEIIDTLDAATLHVVEKEDEVFVDESERAVAILVDVERGKRELGGTERAAASKRDSAANQLRRPI